MAKFERVSSKTRKMILKQLKENFGITDFPYVILSSGKRRFWICPPEVAQINFKGLLIHSIGFYFANIDKNVLRLSRRGQSFESTKDQISSVVQLINGAASSRPLYSVKNEV